MRELIADIATGVTVTILLCWALASGEVEYYYEAERYTMTDLGALLPTAVIPGPNVYGVLNNVPVRRMPSGEIQTLQHSGEGGYVHAADQATGVSVGYVFRNGVAQAAWWNARGELLGLPGTLPSIAYGVNEHGTAVGVTDYRFSAGIDLSIATRWPVGGKEETFERGVAVGVDSFSRAFGLAGVDFVVWTADGRRLPLGRGEHLAAVSPGGTAIGMAGGAAVKVGLDHQGLPTPMTPLPRGEGCAATAINPQGAVVGRCPAAPVIWPTAGGRRDLPHLTSVTGIAFSHHIVGLGPGGGKLLTPRPLVLGMNQSSFRPGDTLRVDLDLTITGDDQTVEMYVAAVLPDGDSTLWLTSVDPVGGVVAPVSGDTRNFVPWLPRVTWARGTATTWQDFIRYTWTGQETAGVYHLLVAWVQPGGLAQGIVAPGALLALDWRQLTFRVR